MRYFILTLMLAGCGTAVPASTASLGETQPGDDQTVVLPPDRQPCTAPFGVVPSFAAQPGKGNVVSCNGREWCVWNAPGDLFPTLPDTTPVCP